MLVRVVRLGVAVHAVSPSIPLDRVVVASYVAVAQETRAVPAEILLAIAIHESELEFRAVSWRDDGGKRVDRLWVDATSAPPDNRRLTCGLMQTAAVSRAACARLLDPTIAFAAGAAEFAEWLEAARGDFAGALSGYAGGNRGIAAWRAGEEADATRFARLFQRQARALGWSPIRHGPGRVPGAQAKVRVLAVPPEERPAS